MKNVLIVFPGLHLDVDEGAKHRLNCHINEYHKRGDSVTVLAICRSGILRQDRKKFMNPNAKWILAPFFIPVSKNIILSRIVDIYVGILTMLCTWLKRFDVVQMETINTRNCLCRKSIYVTDVHGDAVYEEVEPKNMQLDHWFIRYLINVQKHIVSQSDHCIVVSENLRDQLHINTGCLINNYSIISCGVDFEKFSKTEKQKLPIDLSKRIVIGYSGGLQAWQNFDKMIDIVIKVREHLPEAFFLVYTNNSIEPYEGKLKQLGVENYFIKSLMSYEVPGHLKLMDAGFLLRESQILNKVSSPTKICEYLAAGVPVICTQYSGDYKRSILSNSTGFVVEETVLNEKELRELVSWLEDLKINRKEYAIRCMEAASKRTFTEEFEAFYQSLFNN